MSKSTKSVRRTKYQGTTLTLEQYQLLYAFIRLGVTPTRKSLNNAGILRSTSFIQSLSATTKGQVVRFGSLKRFKTIASRLEYRESDDKLVYKINSKIVLPNNRFPEAIKEAHTSGGYKHLNIRCTVDKLSEKYALGSRQYGICEESVRAVIRMCNEGSCADKKKTGEIVFKNFVCTTTRQKESSSKNWKGKPKRRCTSSVEKLQTMQIDETKPLNNASVPVLTHSGGKTETQTSVDQNDNKFSTEQSSYVQIITVAPSMLKMQTVQNTTTPYPLANGVSWPSTMNESMQTYLGNQFGSNIIQAPIANNSALNTFPIQIVQAGSQPVLPGQQIVLVNNSGIPLTTSLLQTMIGISARNSAEPSAMDLSLRQGRNEMTADGVRSIAIKDEPSDTIDALPLKLDSNSNEVKSNQDNSLLLDILNLSHENEISTIPQLADSIDVDGKQEHLSQVIANGSPQVMDTDDNLHEHDKHLKELIPDEESMCPKRNCVPVMPPIPYKEMWYFYDDIAGATNPYNRISMCISDMSLDLRKALVGCWMSVNKLRRKINYIQEIISHQQEATKEYAELTQWD